MNSRYILTSEILQYSVSNEQAQQETIWNGQQIFSLAYFSTQMMGVVVLWNILALS
jgi:hypothetical protein